LVGRFLLTFVVAAFGVGGGFAAAAEEAAACKAGAQRETSLMQLTVQKGAPAEAMLQRANAHSLTVKSFSDAAVARHIREFNVDPLNVARVVRCGIQAILNSLTHFMAQPPRIPEGISELASDLFVCLEELFTDDLASGFDEFKNQWLTTFEGILNAAESIQADIEEYIETGNPPPLIRGISSIIGEAGSLVSNFLPFETAREVRKYLDAIVEALETMGASWDDFANGKTADGIETIYLGLKDITDDLIPDAWKNNTIYVSVVSVLDTVLGNLSQHVLEYERRIMEANVCWRAEESRERQRPEICPDGWASGGDAYCYKLALLQAQQLHAAVEIAKLDMTLYRKDGDDAQGGQLDSTTQQKGGPPEGAVPARCNLSSPYAEKHGQFCYSRCGPGFVAKNYAKCISSCEGKFPAETPAMCGRDPGLVTKAIIEMVTVVINSGFSIAENIIKMKEHGVEAESLSSTVQVFIDMGKPFANPICPVPNATIPETFAPTQSPTLALTQAPTLPPTSPEVETSAPTQLPTLALTQAPTSPPTSPEVESFPPPKGGEAPEGEGEAPELLDE
jgi:hypothetical protein